MQHLTRILFAMFWKFGGPGLLVLGILDSSFLFAPLGNDLLVVALTVSNHDVLKMFYYAAMSTLGSILGVLLVDLALRRAGENGLERHLPRKRIDYFKRKMKKNAAWALVVASIAPPPFPFTPFVMAAAALQYPRKRLLLVTGAARMVRFTSIGILALHFGKRLLGWALQAAIIGLVVVCVASSVISAWGWIRRSRRAEKRPDPPARGMQPAQGRA
jgi:membrane protein YqaA with SNARE-associated domain